MMNEDEIKKILTTIISENNISNIREMGKVMSLSSVHFAGRADNSLVSQVLKTLLSIT